MTSGHVLVTDLEMVRRGMKEPRGELRLLPQEKKQQSLRDHFKEQGRLSHIWKFGEPLSSSNTPNFPHFYSHFQLFPINKQKKNLAKLCITRCCNLATHKMRLQFGFSQLCLLPLGRGRRLEAKVVFKGSLICNLKKLKRLWIFYD